MKKIKIFLNSSGNPWSPLEIDGSSGTMEGDDFVVYRGSEKVFIVPRIQIKYIEIKSFELLQFIEDKLMWSWVDLDKLDDILTKVKAHRAEQKEANIKRILENQ